MTRERSGRKELGEDVGTQLRRARNQQGITRVEAARELEVPEQFLADLEEGRLWPFGPRMHVAAYVRVYARYLGLDPDLVLGPPPAEPVRGVAALAGGLRMRWVLASAAVLLGLGALAGITVVLAQDREDTTDVTLAADEDDSASGTQDAAPRDETEVRSHEAGPRPAPDGDTPEGDQEDRPEQVGTGDALGLTGERDQGSADGETDGAPEPSDGLVGEGVDVQLLDGTGDPDRLEHAREVLVGLGYEIAFVDRAAGTYEETTVLHTEEFGDHVAELLAADDRFTRAGNDPGLTAPADIHIVVGLDWPDP